MTATDVQIEGGEVLASLEDRTITGLLVPYNEVGRTNVGRFQVDAGVINIPEDPEVVGLNLDHNRYAPVGRATKVWETALGIMATFRIAKTPAGDAALADALNPEGKRRRLSGEFETGIKAGRATGGHLSGGALCEMGAFPSAQVLAADTPDEAAPAPAPEDTENGEHLALEVAVLPADITATTPAGDTAVYTPEAAPAEDNPEGESTVTVEATAPGAPAPAPAQAVLASAPKTETAPTITKPREVDLRQVFASIAAVKANPSDEQNRQVLAALTDIKISGNNALPTTDVLRPNWVGQIEQGIPYEREYITLGNLGTQISAGGKKGFKVHRGTSGSPIAGPSGIPNGGNWDGDKTEINSYNGFTETATSSLRKFAVGHDIAREFYDLPGGAEVVEAFLKLVVEDHAFWSDTWALYDIVTAAGVPVAAGTYPTDYPVALGMLIQGILAVKKRKTDGRRDVPTFAIANDEAYAQLVYAAGGDQNLPAFVSIAVSTNSNGTVDGNVVVVQGDTGITGTPSVIVGAKRAIEFDELAGGPLIVNALDIALGGIDRAVHGYLQSFTARDEAIVAIGTPEARANSTAYPLGRLIKASTVVYRVVTAGTSGGSAPTAPAVGATVADGTATLLRLA